MSFPKVLFGAQSGLCTSTIISWFESTQTQQRSPLFCLYVIIHKLGVVHDEDGVDGVLHNDALRYTYSHLYR